MTSTISSASSGSTTDLGSYAAVRQGEDDDDDEQEVGETGGAAAAHLDKEVTWMDLAAAGDDGKPPLIFGAPLKSFNVKELQTICSKLGI
jgi:hypothetical protein